MSSSPIEKIILPNGDECTLGGSEHCLKPSDYYVNDYDNTKTYLRNNVIWFEGKLYYYNGNVTSRNPNEDSDWKIIYDFNHYLTVKDAVGRANIEKYINNTYYYIGDLVDFNGCIYQYITNSHASDFNTSYVAPYITYITNIDEIGERLAQILNHKEITNNNTKISTFSWGQSYEAGTLLINQTGLVMKLTDAYTERKESTFNARYATIEEILDVMSGGGVDLPSYIDIPEFNSNYTYEVGDYVKHDNNMYECISEVDTPDTWDNVSSHFNYTTLPDEVKDASNNAADTILVKDFIGLHYFDESSTFGVGQFVIYDNSIYRCIKDHTGAWSYQDFVQYVLSPELQSFRIKTAGFGDSISQDFYNPNNTYSMGDYVFYTNDSVTGQYSLYKCIGTDVTGTWDSSKWTKVYILDELKALASASGGSTPIYYDISEYSESSTYEVGDYVKHNDNAYRAEYRIDNEAWDSDNFELITFPNDIRRAILHIPDVISLNATIIEAATTIQIPSMSWKEIVNNSNGSIAKKERKLIVNIVRAGSSVNDIVEHQIIIDLTYYNGTATISGYYPIPVNSDGNIEQLYALVDISISETNSFVHSLLGTINFRTSSLTDAWEKVMGSPVSKSVKIMAIGFGQTY